MKVGILDILVDVPSRTWMRHLQVKYYRAQFMSIMPQVLSVWCRQMGHDTHYATYIGLDRPEVLMPSDLDILFISTYTQASALA